jgi:hypothetical protein
MFGIKQKLEALVDVKIRALEQRLEQRLSDEVRVLSEELIRHRVTLRCSINGVRKSEKTEKLLREVVLPRLKKVEHPRTERPAKPVDPPPPMQVVERDTGNGCVIELSREALAAYAEGVK